MEVLKKYKYALLGVAAFAVLAYVYVNFLSTPDVEPLVRGESRGEATTVDRELVAILLSLQSIELDDEVLRSPTFGSLTDFSRDIAAESVGRTNPFAPLNRASARNPR